MKPPTDVALAPSNPSNTGGCSSPTDSPIRVVLRCRPPSQGELAGEGRSGGILQESDDPNSIQIEDRLFKLDGVSFSEKESMTDFYNRFARQSVEDAIMGEDRTILMYGPSGSGKSYNMFAPKGIVPLALRQMMRRDDDIWNLLAQLSKATVAATCLEILHEKVFDLLAPQVVTQNWVTDHSPIVGQGMLKLLQGKAQGAHSVTGSDADELMELIAPALQRRTTVATALNSRSSRSHFVLQFEIRPTGGRLTLVDLAGSECISRSGACNEVAKQAGTINHGLLVLRRVVDALAAKQPHVPFRDSKLTQLLQASLARGGGSGAPRMLMVLCTSPRPEDGHETIMTLHYGATARSIVNLPSERKMLHKLTAKDAQKLMKQLQAKEAHIKALQTQNDIMAARIAALQEAHGSPRSVCHASPGTAFSRTRSEPSASVEMESPCRSGGHVEEETGEDDAEWAKFGAHGAKEQLEKASLDDACESSVGSNSAKDDEIYQQEDPAEEDSSRKCSSQLNVRKRLKVKSRSVQERIPDGDDTEPAYETEDVFNKAEVEERVQLVGDPVDEEASVHCLGPVDVIDGKMGGEVESETKEGTGAVEDATVEKSKGSCESDQDTFPRDVHAGCISRDGNTRVEISADTEIVCETRHVLVSNAETGTLALGEGDVVKEEENAIWVTSQDASPPLESRVLSDIRSSLEETSAHSPNKIVINDVNASISAAEAHATPDLPKASPSNPTFSRPRTCEYGCSSTRAEVLTFNNVIGIWEEWISDTGCNHMKPRLALRTSFEGVVRPNPRTPQTWERKADASPSDASVLVDVTSRVPSRAISHAWITRKGRGRTPLEIHAAQQQPLEPATTEPDGAGERPAEREAGGREGERPPGWRRLRSALGAAVGGCGRVSVKGAAVRED